MTYSVDHARDGERPGGRQVSDLSVKGEKRLGHRPGRVADELAEDPCLVGAYACLSALAGSQIPGEQ